MSDALFQARLAKAIELLEGAEHRVDYDVYGGAKVIVGTRGILDQFLRRWTGAEYSNYFHESAVRVVKTESKITIDRAWCVNCKKGWQDHIPAGGKCPFASTLYHDDDGTLPELHMMNLMPREAMKVTRRPTFNECVKAIRKAAGDKRKFEERPNPENIVFKFPVEEIRRFNNAFNALARLNPVFGEQYTHDEMRREITISRRLCVHCKQKHSEHQPAGGQCLFAATNYEERTDDP